MACVSVKKDSEECQESDGEDRGMVLSLKQGNVIGIGNGMRFDEDGCDHQDVVEDRFGEVESVQTCDSDVDVGVFPKRSETDGILFGGKKGKDDALYRQHVVIGTGQTCVTAPDQYNDLIAAERRFIRSQRFVRELMEVRGKKEEKYGVGKAGKHNRHGSPIATTICSDSLNCWADPTRRSKIMGRTKGKQFEDVDTPTPDSVTPVSSAKGHADKLDITLLEKTLD
ncbi:hypothetical protein NDU88_006977 [Pleurodeles waltl]|uniref:Uncharacterized protein n=1 Tax=Pleurodeles waltl TaxID=8319 RepID=A0AAV7N105_PLEWA|nr:hypothetical protein NDU88_006977 [Pleurodeles waltl]